MYTWIAEVLIKNWVGKVRLRAKKEPMTPNCCAVLQVFTHAKRLECMCFWEGGGGGGGVQLI